MPGLGNSGQEHWQSLWEKQFDFIRIEQEEWEVPVCDEWISTVDEKIMEFNPQGVILVGHSLACSTIVFWAQKYKRNIKGALLVGPSDTEADTYPIGTTGFMPMPQYKLHFPSITIASTNDFYVTQKRAEHFATTWGSKLVMIGEAGHINVASGYGEWPDGLQYLRALDA